MLRHITNMPLEMFQELSHHKKVVILYPWISYRNLFLAYFLQQSNSGVLYYRVSGEVTSVEQLVMEITSEMTLLTTHPSDAANAVAKNHTPAQIGVALASDLERLAQGEGHIVLFLDEIDRLGAVAGLEDTVRAFVAALPDNVQVAISARALTYQPWSEFVQQGIAAVLGTNDRTTNLMFTLIDDPKPQLEVYAFGRGYAFVNGNLIDNWEGSLPRNLFFYFLDNKMVTRDQIFSIFWDALPKKEATNVFHVTKRKITESISGRLANDEHYELTHYEGGFYIPSDKIMRHYDVADFEAAIDAADRTFDDGQILLAYQRAIAIYRAPFLQTVPMPWVQARRQKLQQAYTDALIGVGRVYKRQQDYDTALGYFIRALRQAALREDVHREVMTLYMQLERPGDARAQYYTLAHQLDKHFGVQPSRATRDLYEQISSAI